MKKYTSKTNNFDVSQLKAKGRNQEGFKKEKLIEEHQKEFISQISLRFQSIFDLLKQIYQNFYKYIAQRKNYLYEKVKLNEASYQSGLEQYD